MTEVRVRIGQLTLLFVLCGPFLLGPALALSTYVLTGETRTPAMETSRLEPRAIVEAMLLSAILWWAGTLSIVFGLLTWVPTVAAAVVSGHVLRWVLSGMKPSLTRARTAMLSAIVCAVCSAVVYWPVYWLLDRSSAGAQHPAVHWLAVAIVGFVLGGIAGAWPRIISSSGGRMGSVHRSEVP